MVAGVSEHRGKIEPKAVHAHDLAPVSKRIDDEVLRDGIVGVVIAADAGVVEGELHIRSQRVIGWIVQPAEGRRL